MPRSDGTPEIVPAEGSLVVTEEFLIAVTHNKVSEVMEMPLSVVAVPQSSWKRMQ